MSAWPCNLKFADRAVLWSGPVASTFDVGDPRQIGHITCFRSFLRSCASTQLRSPLPALRNRCHTIAATYFQFHACDMPVTPEWRYEEI
ncbi:hypothetical protein X946_3397 [Burkholderia sp. ABCPW 111]|nr:hypothetical protein X946_3397 [Burkholderia sp. ABCPW 111]